MNKKQIQTVQSAINALDRLHQWLRHKHLGGLMPDEMQVLKDLRLMVNENELPSISIKFGNEYRKTEASE